MITQFINIFKDNRKCGSDNIQALRNNNKKLENITTNPYNGNCDIPKHF